ncbi:MAG TPA: N-acetyl-gamma-glutamyl-phosphate reductase [Vulgatibacter sp.]
MNEAAVGIYGASGYSGIELTRILAGHPLVRVAFLASDRWAGSTAADRLGSEVESVGTYVGTEEAEALAGSCDVVMLATPAEASLRLAPRLLEKGCRVIDLSGAFRLEDAGAFERYYGLQSAGEGPGAYGLPELFRAEAKGARLVANPGCYATAAALSLAPLLRAGLVEPGTLIVDAASGVTGAGRKASEDFSFAEIAEDFRAYRVLRHQHTPEIEQTLSRFSGDPVATTFTPHLLPIRRGILSTAYGRLREKATAADLTRVLEEAYAGEPFVRVAKSADEVSLRKVVGTNRCLIGVASEGKPGGVAVIVSALDNLVKGAAGQAVQNLNLLLELDEATGLAGLRGTST